MRRIKLRPADKFTDLTKDKEEVDRQMCTREEEWMLIAHTYIERQTHQTALERERYTYTHQQTAAGTLRSSGLVVCVTVAPHPGQRYSRRIRSLNFTRHSSRHGRYAIFSTAHTHTHTRCMLMIRQITSHFCLTNTHEYKLLDWKFGRTGIIN